MKTIAEQIEEIERDIEKCEERLEAIDRMGRLSAMDDEEWSRLKQERQSLKQQVSDKRKKLKNLRWENWRSMLVSVVIMGLVYAGYTVFSASVDGETSTLSQVS